jgi:hypothetical protein
LFSFFRGRSDLFVKIRKLECDGSDSELEDGAIDETDEVRSKSTLRDVPEGAEVEVEKQGRKVDLDGEMEHQQSSNNDDARHGGWRNRQSHVERKDKVTLTKEIHIYFDACFWEDYKMFNVMST